MGIVIMALPFTNDEIRRMREEVENVEWPNLPQPSEDGVPVLYRLLNIAEEHRTLSPVKPLDWYDLASQTVRTFDASTEKWNDET